MKKNFVLFALFAALFFAVSCGGGKSGESSKNDTDNVNDEDPGRKQGELYGECYPNGTCNKGLVCDEENNICIKDPGNTEEPEDDTDKDDGKDDDDTDTSAVVVDDDTDTDSPDTTPDHDTDTDQTDPAPDEDNDSDTDTETPEVTENHKISGSYQIGSNVSGIEATLYECGQNSKIASANTNTSGKYSFNADISAEKTYCVKANGFASCFKGMSDHTANISEITDAAYLLDTNCTAMRKSETVLRAYAKLGTGAWLGELDYSKLSGIKEGLKLLSSFLSTTDSKTLSQKIAEDAKKTEKSFVKFFNGFKVLSDKNEVVINTADASSNEIKFNIEGGSNAVAEGFRIVWTALNSTNISATHKIATVNPGEYIVRAKLVYAGGDPIMISEDSLSVFYLLEKLSGTIDVSDMSKDISHYITNGIYAVIPKNTVIRKGNSKVNTLTYKILTTGDGSQVSKISFEPEGTTFSGDSMYFIYELGTVFGGDPIMLSSTRTNSDGSSNVLESTGGDPIMLEAGGDPIMFSAGGDPIMQIARSAGGDPIMMSAGGDPIMMDDGGDPIMSAAAGDPIMITAGGDPIMAGDPIMMGTSSSVMVAKTGHFSGFMLHSNTLQMAVDKLIEKWCSGSYYHGYSPLEFIRQGIQKYKPAGEAKERLLSYFSCSRFGELESDLYELINRPLGHHINLNLFENIFYISEFYNRLSLKKANGEKAAVKNGLDLKAAIAALYTATTAYNRSSTTADSFDSAMIPMTYSGSSPADYSSDAQKAITGLSEINNKYVASKKELMIFANYITTSSKGPDFSEVSSQLTTDQLICAWMNPDTNPASCNKVYTLNAAGHVAIGNTEVSVDEANNIFKKFFMPFNSRLSNAEKLNIFRTFYLTIRYAGTLFHSDATVETMNDDLLETAYLVFDGIDGNVNAVSIVDTFNASAHTVQVLETGDMETKPYLSKLSTLTDKISLNVTDPANVEKVLIKIEGSEFDKITENTRTYYKPKGSVKEKSIILNPGNMAAGLKPLKDLIGTDNVDELGNITGKMTVVVNSTISGKSYTTQKTYEFLVNDTTDGVESKPLPSNLTVFLFDSAGHAIAENKNPGIILNPGSTVFYPNEDGIINITDLNPASYTIDAFADGYYAKNVGVNVPENATLSVEIRLDEEITSSAEALLTVKVKINTVKHPDKVYLQIYDEEMNLVANESTKFDENTSTYEDVDIDINFGRYTLLAVGEEMYNYVETITVNDENAIKEITVVAKNACGNGIVDSGEECEISSSEVRCGDIYPASMNPENKTVCDPATCVYDKAQCGKAAYCGDGIIDLGEGCDGGSKACSEIAGFASAKGTAPCAANCSDWIVAGNCSKTTESCGELPQNALWNDGIGHFTQVWNGENWAPAAKGGVYGTTREECVFSCEKGYKWNGSECVEESLSLGNICTGQTSCFDSTSATTECPVYGSSFFGQDWQYAAAGYCTQKDFTQEGSGAEAVIIDSFTHFKWQKTASAAAMNWAGADEYCMQSTYGGTMDWRLPTPTELLTIVDNAALASVFQTSGSTFWATEDAKNDANAWKLSNGELTSVAKSTQNYVICIRQYDKDPSDGRFVQNENETVTDSESNLIWQRSYTSSKTWQEALSYCENLTASDHYDWRLPNRNELASLIDFEKTSGAASTFPGIAAEKFWTSTSTDSAPEAFAVDFAGVAITAETKSNTNYVLCVRSENLCLGDESECVNACAFEPCRNTINSTGVCTATANGNSYSCVCYSGYKWDGFLSKCVLPEFRTQGCDVDQLPENAIWNQTPTITQYPDGLGNWYPTTLPEYNETPSTSECRFKCKDHYNWDYDVLQCIPEIRIIQCTRTIQEPAEVWTLRYITQTWNGTEWEPSEHDLQFGEDENENKCQYKCNTSEHYIRDGEVCVKGTCPENHFWNGEDCVNPCEPNPCSAGQSCTSLSATAHQCGCENGYRWNGYECERTALGNICTGQTQCYNDTRDIECPAPTAKNYFGQDAQYAKSGVCTANDFTDPEDTLIITDKSTNLMWQKGYTASKTWAEANTYCSGLTLEGKTGWRVPTPMELVSILDKSMSDPAIDSDYFDYNSEVVNFWTSQALSSDNAQAWKMQIAQGTLSYSAKTERYAVRCVKGSQYTYTTKFMKSKSGGELVIVDENTHLIWKQNLDAKSGSWKAAMKSCEALNYAGYDDWRLPNINELLSIANYATTSPATNFPELRKEKKYWSSTSSDSTSKAMVLDFEKGEVLESEKNNNTYYICVRLSTCNNSDCISACVNNPCSTIAHSDNICTPESDSNYSCGCEETYYWDGSKCTNPCDPNPCNGMDYSTGNCILDTLETYYCECDDNASWDGMACKHPCDPNPCGDKEHSTGICTPDASGNYSCGCEETYDWDGSACSNQCSNNPCAGKPNSTEECILETTGYSCGCNENYYWNGANCINPCSSNPCAGKPNSTGECISESFDSYSCGCSENYTWNGTECHKDSGDTPLSCDDNPCDDIENSTGICITGNNNSYSCECFNSYFWSGTDCVNPCEGNPCANFNNTTGTCSPKSWDIYTCGCINGYYWWGTNDGCTNKKPSFAHVCTGITQCYNDDNAISCPAQGEDFYGQDPQYAELGFCVPQIFSDDNTVESEKTVIDNYLELEWQSTEKSDYSWSAANNYCSNLNYGGHSDWRLPNPNELYSISKKLNNSSYRWSTYNSEGQGYYYGNNNYTYNATDASTKRSVQCVRGEAIPSGEFMIYKKDGSEIIYDRNTDLIWQKISVESKRWKDALAYCEGLNYAGYSDWRLPNKNELASLANYNKYPASDFMPSKKFWSSSGFKTSWGCDGESNISAFAFNFSEGTMTTDYTSTGYNVLCVRTNECEEGYFNNGATCERIQTRTVECNGLPDNASWNTVSSITQMWNGTEWSPSATGSYNTTKSSIECCFKCNNNYFWDGSACESPCDPNPCTNDTNSDGVCTVIDAGIYYCGCNEGYSWNNGDCTEYSSTGLTVGNICTGQTKCYSSKDGATACPVADFFGQDAQYAELGYCTPQSFQVKTVSNEKTTIDKNTGLQWQQTITTNLDWNNAWAYCDTLSYAGYNDWRLPTPSEFLTIADSNKYSPAQNTNYFPNSNNSSYLWWTSKTYKEDTNKAFSFDSYHGSVGATLKTSSMNVRCIRGQELPKGIFTISTVNNDAVVTDSTTGLMWQKNYTEKNWQQALEYCENLTYAGYTDWRLPNKNELASLLNYDKSFAPYSDFPDIPDGSFESSTSYYYNSSSAWSIDSSNGYVDASSKNSIINVFCVRIAVCNNDEFWNGSECVHNPCQSDSCNIDHSAGYCQPITDSTFECICENDYFWNGSACVSPCDTNPCANDAHSDGVCTAINLNIYYCGCNDNYSWNAGSCKEYSTGLTIGNICTGQNKCYNNESEFNCPVLGEDFFGQDAQYTSECSPHIFSIDSTVENEKTIVDNNTGLEWQQTIPTETYTWKNAWAYCDTLTYGGHDDWRLPTPIEFLTIADASSGLDKNYFTNIKSQYLTSKNIGKWVFHFNTSSGSYGRYEADYKLSAMCVRGNQLPTSTFTTSTIEDDTIVIDNLTGLIWQKTYVRGKTWQKALEYCENLTYAGYSDWRLPNKNELASLVNLYKTSAPYSDFPDATDDGYAWTSTSIGVTNTANGSFNYGEIGSGLSKTRTDTYVRCVRDNCNSGEFWNGSACVNPCNTNPCGDVANSSGICTPLSAKNYICECNENYTWNYSTFTCEADTRTYTCTGKPANSTWNSVSSYTQTWNGSAWIPADSNATYNEEASTTECRFKCNTDFTWNTSTLKCEAPTKIYTCSGKPENSSWNSVSSYTQTWNGSVWTPADSDATYNTTASTTECRFKCDTNYFWDGSACLNPCDSNPCSNVVNSTGTCTPKSATTYTCGCKSNYIWDGSYCQNPCLENPCNSVAHSTGLCTTRTATTYSCRCNDSYFWNGSICAIIPECNATANTPCTNSERTLIWSSKSDTTMNYSDATAYCENSYEGGYDDWSVPTIGELRTLIQNCPATQTNGPCGVTDNCSTSNCKSSSCAGCSSGSALYSYLGDTETLWAEYSSTYWSIDFEAAKIVSETWGISLNNIRCIRNGICEFGEFWNGSECINPCTSNPCSGIESSTETCTAINATEYYCGCVNSYYWNSSTLKCEQNTHCGDGIVQPEYGETCETASFSSSTCYKPIQENTCDSCDGGNISVTYAIYQSSSCNSSCELSWTLTSENEETTCGGSVPEPRCDF